MSQTTSTPVFANPKAGEFRRLAQWYLPYLKGSGGRLFVAVALTLLTLAAAGYMPLFIENMLHHAHVDARGIAILIALILIQVVGGHIAHLVGHHAALLASLRLSSRVFDGVVHAKGVKQHLGTTSQTSRVTSDVQNVSEAFESSLVSGIPGVIRLLQSLALLFYISPDAGLVMIGSSLLFLVFRSYIGKKMLRADKDLLDTRTTVNETVDEFLNKSRTAAGLRLEKWVARRLEKRLEELEHRGEVLGNHLTELITAAHAAGLAGVFTVVTVAALGDENALASAAAAFLYVEGVVKGLEALPAWVRSLQLGVVSRHRIDEILKDQDSDVLPPRASEVSQMDWNKVGVLGFVTSDDLASDDVLAQMTADVSDGKQWRHSTAGEIVRLPGFGQNTIHIPRDANTFVATIREHFTSQNTAISESDMRGYMQATGCAHLLNNPQGFDVTLSARGLSLSLDERQRFLVAVALASKPERLLLGELNVCEDVESATPFLHQIKQHVPLTLVGVRNAELADSLQEIVWVQNGKLTIDQHKAILLSDSEYSRVWERRLNANAVDLSVIGIDAANSATVATTMRTEMYSAGDIIYREGEPANRVLFVISGRVEISTLDANGNRNRVAILGPGNHCGDLSLTVGEQRAETAIAHENCVIRSLSRDAISIGMAGMLDRTPAERKILAQLMRNGALDSVELAGRLPELDEAALKRALDLLVADGAVIREGETLRVVQKRTTRRGSRELLDRLGDF